MQGRVLMWPDSFITTFNFNGNGDMVTATPRQYPSVKKVFSNHNVPRHGLLLLIFKLHITYEDSKFISFQKLNVFAEDANVELRRGERVSVFPSFSPATC
jgi:hypothetical protein